MNPVGALDFNAPALQYARKDFPLLQADASVEKALEKIRREGVGERVIYFYAVDQQRSAVSVRRLRNMRLTMLGRPFALTIVGLIEGMLDSLQNGGREYRRIAPHQVQLLTNDTLW